MGEMHRADEIGQFETDIQRVVHDNENGWNVKVLPDRDGLGLLEIEGGDEFGRLMLPANMAVHVAKAVHDCARELLNRAALSKAEGRSLSSASGQEGGE